MPWLPLESFSSRTMRKPAAASAFSKKYENHCHALVLYFFHYNFCRIHKSLRTSPAQALASPMNCCRWSLFALS